MTASLGPEEWQAVALSLKVSFWATLLSLPPGLFIAYALARWQFWGKQVLNGLVHLPLILPPVVTGYLLLLVFGPAVGAGQQGPFGSSLVYQVQQTHVSTQESVHRPVDDARFTASR